MPGWKEPEDVDNQGDCIYEVRIIPGGAGVKDQASKAEQIFKYHTF